MKLLIGILIVTVAVVVWVLWGRDWLKRQPWLWSQRFFAWIEPAEIMFWSKSETIFFARFLQVLGVLLTALAQLGEFDLTPLMPFIPDEYKWIPALLPLVVSIAGSINVKLREATTKPLEVVALPEAKTPAVAAAVEKAEVATQTAVAVVAADKAATVVAGVADTKPKGGD